MGIGSKLKKAIKKTVNPKNAIKTIKEDPKNLLFDPGTFWLNETLIDPIAEGTGQDWATSDAALDAISKDKNKRHWDQIREAAKHMYEAGGFTGYIPGQTVDNWDDFRRATYAANRDWTAAHPGVEETVEVTDEKGWDVRGHLGELSTGAGTVGGYLGGPIVGAIAGGAGGWGLGSQYGTSDEEYKAAYGAAGAGALSGVMAGYSSDGGVLNDGGSSGAAVGSEGQLMGDVAGLSGAEANLIGGEAGGYVGATQGYTIPETITASINQYLSDPYGYTQSYATDYVNENYLGGYGDAMANEWSTEDTVSLLGDMVKMYGQYQGQEAQQDAIKQAMATNQEAAKAALGMYAPYMQAGNTGLTGLLGMNRYDVTRDPQYQMQMEEMSRRMNDRSAALGMARSSADLKSRAAAGAGLYQDAYNRAYNRYADLVGLGRYGTTGSANAQLGLGNTVSNLQLQGGSLLGAQTAGLYGGMGDLLSAPQQYQQNQQLLNILAQNRGY